ncbi:MAG: gephyrin-like molybdotransferase Glp [Gammaproteobacteria bacterium]|nr:gephyrin-like molybdotransferase Glp [Gammaproteobacteria bacterium]
MANFSPLLLVDDVIERLLSQAKPVTETECVHLTACIGRVLAEDMASKIDVPPAANSSMDGYAVATSDPALRAGATLPVEGRIAAGQVGKPLVSGRVARIFTGAPLPEGADAVVMQENTEANGDGVVIRSVPDTGENIRPAGQDIQAGTRLFSAGRRLRPEDAAVLASVGIDQVPVYRRLRVALMSTGDELVDPPGELAPGQIYNSNHFALVGLVRRLGMEVLDVGLVPDDFDATVRALSQAAGGADCIISSGGVSVGEEDYVKAALEQLGGLEMWRVAIKPGKPLAFGNVAGTPFFGLPGNPVSTYVTFTIMAAPWLRAVQGMTDVMPHYIWARAAFEMPAGTRREYVRVRVEPSGDGTLKATSFGNQGSGIMSSVSWANALAEVDIDQEVSYGDRLKVFLLQDWQE